jgi:hypothetical protein
MFVTAFRKNEQLQRQLQQQRRKRNVGILPLRLALLAQGQNDGALGMVGGGWDAPRKGNTIADGLCLTFRGRLSGIDHLFWGQLRYVEALPREEADTWPIS